MFPLLGDQHLVEPGQPLGVHLARQLASDFDLALMPKLQGDQLARPVADAMGDIVAGDIQNLAVASDAPDDDVGMGMAGVMVIDGDPVERGVQIRLHLPHQVTGKASKVAHVGGVLGRDDKAELVPVLSAALDEGAAVRLVLDGGIGAALFAIARCPIAFEVAQMGVGRLARRTPHLRAARGALRIELHDARLDDDAAGPKPAGGIAPPSAAVLGKGRRHLRASATGVEPPASLSGRAADPARIAACFPDGGLHLI